MQQQPDVPVETDGLKEEGVALVTTARSLSIMNHEGYAFAGQELVRVARVRKGIEFAFKEPKSKAYEAHRAISKLESDLLAYPKEAERIIKNAMARFSEEDARRRRAAEAEERERLRKREEDRILEEALALEGAGDHEGAVAAIEEEALAPIVEMERPKAEGVSERKAYRFEIIDESALPREFMVPNEIKIRKLVNALGKDAERQVPGIRVREELVMSVRANG